MGYAPPGTSPLEPIALAQEAERLGYDSAWAAEAWGTDCVTVLSWLGATTERIKLGSRDHADPRPHAREHGDDRGDARPALGRALPARARDLGAAGGRGLARRAVGQAAREDARVRRDRAHGAAARGRRAPRRALRHPALERDRAREAAEADGAAAARRHPDLPRGDGAEGGRAGVRDRRRLAPDLLVAREGARGLRRRDGGRARGLRHRRPPRPRSSSTTSRPAASSSSRTTRSTSAAWARAGRTSTTTSSPLRLRGDGAEDPGPLPRREQARRRRGRCPTRSWTRSRSSGRRSSSRSALDAWRESGATSLLVSTQQPEALRALAEIAL